MNMTFLSTLFNRTPQHKGLPMIGEGKDGKVFDYSPHQILKISKQKSFQDGDILRDLEGLSTFPSLSKYGKN